MPPRIVDLPLTKPLITLIQRYERAVVLARRAQAAQQIAEERFQQAQAAIRHKDRLIEDYKRLEDQIEFLKAAVKNGPITIRSLTDPDVPEIFTRKPVH